MEYLEQLIKELEKSLANRYIGDSDYIEALEKDIIELHTTTLGSIYAWMKQEDKQWKK